MLPPALSPDPGALHSLSEIEQQQFGQARARLEELRGEVLGQYSNSNREVQRLARSVLREFSSRDRARCGWVQEKTALKVMEKHKVLSNVEKRRAFLEALRVGLIAPDGTRGKIYTGSTLSRRYVYLYSRSPLIHGQGGMSDRGCATTLASTYRRGSASIRKSR